VFEWIEFVFVQVSYSCFSREKSGTFRFLLCITHAFYFEHLKIAPFSCFFMSVTYDPLRIYDFNLNATCARFCHLLIVPATFLILLSFYEI